MKCLSCAFATEANPFHLAAPSPLPPPPLPPPAAAGLQVDGALFKSESHLLGLAGRFGLMKYVLPSGPAARLRGSLNHKGEWAGVGEVEGRGGAATRSEGGTQGRRQGFG